MDVDAELAFVAVARICDVDLFVSCKQDMFLFEYDERMFIMLKGAKTFRRFLRDGTDEIEDIGDKMCPIFHTNDASHGMTKKY